MSFLRFFNIAAALRDLRQFLATRRKHDLLFAALAVGITTTVMVGFYLDGFVNMMPPWKRQITYIESWPADRSLEEILAQQKIDMEKKKVEDAKLEAERKKRQAEFKKIDDALNRWGL
ncbi:hypothetical protein ACMT1E_14460 [Sphingomonas flavalba]|uniref:hypothetical protein n=1 Tax=Sphingomonas flavalba TaxID=2559804 RepID=UPI0039E094B7